MTENLMNWTDQIMVASLSDVGMRRSNNQDNLLVSLANSMDHYQRKGHLFIVADGMGAHAAGELASKLAIDHIPHLYNKYNDSSAPDELKKAVADANGEIHRRGQANEEFHNMGTTCSVLTLLPQGAFAAHIGDSRIYRQTQNRLEQLTFDHSLVWEMKAAGQLTAEEEKSGRIPKNVITRSLGPYAECKVDLEGPFPIQVGDSFLLCSDGLTAVIEDAEIGAILANMNPEEAARVLVDLANLRGGPDNITVVIVKVTHPQLGTNHNVKPTRTNASKVGSAVPPFLWALFAAACAFALLFGFYSSPAAAIIPGMVALGTAIAIATFLIMATKTGQFLTDSRRLGKGPYIRLNCALSPQFSKQLAEILHELQTGALQKKWEVDWEQWKSLIATAESAVKEKNYSLSIRSYGLAISFLMDQLRNQDSGSGSSLEL